ncbi:MAG: DegQ family serine endoprotease [Deltaproteobacteria bacterium]|nr:DegQ family serine endoprotease [Deltaproteobacteria bacterium]
MNKLLRIKLFLLVALLTFGWTVSAEAQPPDFVSLAEQLKPAVVNIGTAKTVKPKAPMYPGPQGPGGDMFEEFFERFFRNAPQSPHKQRSLGSGFIISQDGYILTNDHVVDGADEIKVKLSDGREFAGEIRGLDPKLDLALIKIDAGEDLPVAKLGDSEEIKIGEWVMAIGNPFGLEQTVTVGIVSAKGRVIGAGPYDDFIQTDASINPGNSGGPLFNMQGEVIGINTAIVAQGQGIGFAIPVDMAKQIIPQLRDEGRVTRGWLGVTVQALNKELAESFALDTTHGALVNEVIEDSPADKAGLKRGDIIVEYDGKQVDELNDLPRLVAATPVDETVKVKVFRDGKERTINVKIGRLDDGEVALAADDEETGGALGLTVANVTPELVERYSLESDQGILITKIDPEGPAAEANLRVGDLVVEADGKEVGSVKEFEELVGKMKSGKVLRLLIQRRATLLYTTVTLK